jgi:hypothetical protein
MSTEKLPQWDGSGHLSDLALVALADGQDAIVDADARAHADSCEACAGKLADLALQSVAVGEAMMSARTRRLPARAVLFAIALAVVGIVPSLLEGNWVSDIATAPHRLMAFADALAQLVRAFGHAPVGTAATFGASLLLVALGVLVARQKRAVRMS